MYTGVHIHSEGIGTVKNKFWYRKMFLEEQKKKVFGQENQFLEQ